MWFVKWAEVKLTFFPERERPFSQQYLCDMDLELMMDVFAD